MNERESLKNINNNIFILITIHLHIGTPTFNLTKSRYITHTGIYIYNRINTELTKVKIKPHLLSSSDITEPHSCVTILAIYTRISNTQKI